MRSCARRSAGDSTITLPTNQTQYNEAHTRSCTYDRNACVGSACSTLGTPWVSSLVTYEVFNVNTQTSEKKDEQ